MNLKDMKDTQDPKFQEHRNGVEMVLTLVSQASAYDDPNGRGPSARFEVTDGSMSTVMFLGLMGDRKHGQPLGPEHVGKQIRVKCYRNGDYVNGFLNGLAAPGMPAVVVPPAPAGPIIAPMTSAVSQAAGRDEAYRMTKVFTAVMSLVAAGKLDRSEVAEALAKYSQILEEAIATPDPVVAPAPVPSPAAVVNPGHLVQPAPPVPLQSHAEAQLVGAVPDGPIPF